MTEAPTHPLIRRLFASLEQRELLWTLQRLPSNPEAPTGDVDLLVWPEHAEALRAVAMSLGFVPLPGWKSAPDLILVHYDRPSDCWLLLDVATTVSFRTPRDWRLTGMERGVLRRRQVRDGIALPADADAFWLLLLHCLLDKRTVAPHYRRRLQRLVASGSSSPIGQAACRAAGQRVTPEAFLAAVSDGDWELLERRGRQLATGLKRHRGARERLAPLASHAVATARKPFLLPRRRGVNLALLGPDGSGKSTAAALLQRSFPFESRVMHMGVWKAVGGNPARQIAEIATRPLRIWCRYLLAQYHQLRGRLVIFDRYVYEAALPAKPPLVAAKRPYFWFLARVLPRARSAVVLDVPGHVTYRRKQENPPDQLESERRIYAGLARKVPSVDLVDAVHGPETVAAEISAIVWRDVERRWKGGR